MNLKYKTNFISEAQYLEDEKNREIKHEYIDGEVYAMSGASLIHNLISGNVYAEFRFHLKDTRCNAFMADVKVKNSTKNSTSFFYPDVLVSCDDENGHNHFTEKPLIIAEVLSKSTRRYDRTLKFNAYITIPTLQEYVLIEQDFAEVEVCRRSKNWISERYFLGDEVSFESIGLTLSVEAIYSRVQNEDVLEFLKAKELAQQENQL